MIIFGTKGVTTTPSTGEFHCPTCNSLQSYGLKRVRNFFTLYFIPLIPLNKLGEYIECKKCRDAYNLSVLDMPVENSVDMEAEYNSGIKKAMIHVLLADGVIDDAEVKTAQDIYNKVTGNNLDATKLREEIDSIQKNNEKLSDLSKLQGCLNDEGKELVIQASYFVAMADGDLHREELALIVKIGKKLGMTDAHINGVLSSLAEE